MTVRTHDIDGTCRGVVRDERKYSQSPQDTYQRVNDLQLFILHACCE